MLWLSLFYGSLWLAFGEPVFLAAFLVYTILDVLYAFFQDRWTFMHMFTEYGEYRQETPFLLPTPTSLRRCIGSLKRGGDAD